MSSGDISPSREVLFKIELHARTILQLTALLSSLILSFLAV